MNKEMYITVIKAQIAIYDSIKDMFGSTMPDHELFKRQEEVILVMKSLVADPEIELNVPVEDYSNETPEDEKERKSHLYDKIVTELSSFLPSAMKVLSLANEHNGTDFVEIEFTKVVSNSAMRLANMIHENTTVKTIVNTVNK